MAWMVTLQRLHYSAATLIRELVVGQLDYGALDPAGVGDVIAIRPQNPSRKKNSREGSRGDPSACVWALIHPNSPPQL